MGKVRAIKEHKSAAVMRADNQPAGEATGQDDLRRGSISNIELERKNAELAALYRVSLTVSQTINLDELLSQVLETVTGLELFSIIKKAGIILVEDEEMELVSYLGEGHTPEFLDLHKGMEVGDCLCGQVARTGEMVTSWDSVSDSRHTIRYPGMLPHGHVIVPLSAFGETMGVMYLYLPAGTSMEQRSLEVLLSVGEQVGIAIANAKAYQNELASRTKIEGYVKRLSALSNIATLLNKQTDTRSLLKLLLEGAAELTSASYGFIFTAKEGRINPPLFCHAKGAMPVPTDTDYLLLERNLEKINIDRVITVAGAGLAKGGRADVQDFLLCGMHDDEPGLSWYMILGKKTNEFSGDEKRLISLLIAQAAAAVINIKSFENEHLIAETLQSALLAEVPAGKGLDIGLVYLSASKVGKVGGDFYDFVELDENRLAIAIGDVSGKGLETAEYSAMIKFMLRAYLRDGKDPGQCLTSLNRAIVCEIEEDMFVTACILILDRERGLATYSSAGHFTPIVCRNEWDFCSMDASPSIPMGIFPERQFDSSHKSIKDVCGMVMFTDGLVEARDTLGNRFKEENIVKLLPGLRELSSQQIAEKIYEDAVHHAGGRLKDDITLIVIKSLPE